MSPGAPAIIGEIDSLATVVDTPPVASPTLSSSRSAIPASGLDTDKRRHYNKSAYFLNWYPYLMALLALILVFLAYRWLAHARADAQTNVNRYIPTPIPSCATQPRNVTLHSTMGEIIPLMSRHSLQLRYACQAYDDLLGTELEPAAKAIGYALLPFNHDISALFKSSGNGKDMAVTRWTLFDRAVQEYTIPTSRDTFSSRLPTSLSDPLGPLSVTVLNGVERKVRGTLLHACEAADWIVSFLKVQFHKVAE